MTGGPGWPTLARATRNCRTWPRPAATSRKRLRMIPASRRHSFGMQRAEVLGALVNGLFMLAVGLAVLLFFGLS